MSNQSPAEVSRTLLRCSRIARGRPLPKWLQAPWLFSPLVFEDDQSNIADYFEDPSACLDIVHRSEILPFFPLSPLTMENRYFPTWFSTDPDGEQKIHPRIRERLKAIEPITVWKSESHIKRSLEVSLMPIFVNSSRDINFFNSDGFSDYSSVKATSAGTIWIKGQDQGQDLHEVGDGGGGRHWERQGPHVECPNCPYYMKETSKNSGNICVDASLPATPCLPVFHLIPEVIKF